MSGWTDQIAVFPRHWIWDKRPVYHLRKEDFTRTEDEIAMLTRCGITLCAWSQETGEYRIDRDTTMLREHAEKFARLCGNCARSAS